MNSLCINGDHLVNKIRRICKRTVRVHESLSLPTIEKCMRSGLLLAMMLAASSLAEAETPLTIEQLLAQGWEIAGYASGGYDNRTSLILFRHPGVNALVQCGILYDVTRAQGIVVNCYELQ